MSLSRQNSMKSMKSNKSQAVINLERKASIISNQGKSEKNEVSILKEEQNSSTPDKRKGFAESRGNTLRPAPLKNTLSEVKESKDEQLMSPRKHKILEDIYLSHNNRPPPNENSQNEQQLLQSNVTKEKNKEEENIFSNFFNNIFTSKKEAPAPVNTLTREQIAQSTILQEIYSEEQPKPSENKGKKEKIPIARQLTNLNDILQTDQSLKTENNPGLQNFLTDRNRSSLLMPTSNIVHSQNISVFPANSRAQQITHSIYLNRDPTHPESYRLPLNSGYQPAIAINSSLYQQSKSKSNYQPIDKGIMTNEEVKQYLKSLDTYFALNSKKPPRSTSSHYENFSLIRPKSLNYNYEEERSLAGEKNSVKNREFVDNEELEELHEKYSKSIALTRSVALIKKSNGTLDLGAYNARIGDIACSNCQEFMAPEELDKHSLVCYKKLEEWDLMRINQKLEKMKLMLIINFKNMEITKKQSYSDLEELMGIGSVIIDEMLENNKSLSKLKESYIDFQTLIKNLPTLNNKSSQVFKVLSERVLQLTQVKIDAIRKIQPREPEPLKIEIPKQKSGLNFMNIKRIITREGGCCGCGERENVEYVVNEGEGNHHDMISYNEKNRKGGCCG